MHDSCLFFAQEVYDKYCNEFWIKQLEKRIDDCLKDPQLAQGKDLKNTAYALELLTGVNIITTNLLTVLVHHFPASHCVVYEIVLYDFIRVLNTVTVDLTWKV